MVVIINKWEKYLDYLWMEPSNACIPAIMTSPGAIEWFRIGLTVMLAIIELEVQYVTMSCVMYGTSWACIYLPAMEEMNLQSFRVI